MRPLNEIIKDPSSHLIDVRTPQEVRDVNIDRAENIPMDKISENLEQFKNMEGDIVVFCRSGARSENVKNWLKQNGVENVVNAGGFSDVKMHLS